MAYTFTLSDIIPASPEAIYNAWLDSRGHSAMTGGKATASAEVGGAFTAWDGYISGRNVQLVPGTRIVQTWRTTAFTHEQQYSVITVLLAPAPGGTRVTIVHANVPDDHKGYESGGWQDHYFTPMKAYFGTSQAAKPAAKPKAAKAKAAKAKPPKTKTSKAGAAKAKTASVKKAKARKTARKATKARTEKSKTVRAAKTKKTVKRKTAARKPAKRAAAKRQRARAKKRK